MIYCKWRNNDNIITDTYVKENLQIKLLKLSVSRSNSRERLREKNKTSLDPIMWNKNTHHRLQNNLQLQTPFIKNIRSVLYLLRNKIWGYDELPNEGIFSAGSRHCLQDSSSGRLQEPIFTHKQEQKPQ